MQKTSQSGLYQSMCRCRAFFHSAKQFSLQPLLLCVSWVCGLNMATFLRNLFKSFTSLHILEPRPARNAAPYKDVLELVSLLSIGNRSRLLRYWHRKSLWATPPLILNQNIIYVKFSNSKSNIKVFVLNNLIEFIGMLSVFKSFSNMSNLILIEKTIESIIARNI